MSISRAKTTGEPVLSDDEWSVDSNACLRHSVLSQSYLVICWSENDMRNIGGGQRLRISEAVFHRVTVQTMS